MKFEWTDEKIKEAVALYKSGLSGRAIARKFGCDATGACKRIKEYRTGVMPKKELWSAKVKAVNLKLDRGITSYTLSDKEIAERYGKPGAHQEKVPLMVEIMRKTEAQRWGMEA